VRFQCSVCAHIYDEKLEGTSWGDLPDDWVCPICGADKSYFEPMDATAAGGGPPTFRSPVQPVAVADADIAAYLEQWRRPTDDLESTMAAIQQAAISGETVIEPMRSRKSVPGFDPACRAPTKAPTSINRSKLRRATASQPASNR